ncbi:cell division protein PerM [Streptomyces zingiberis]|uniref:Integral membrane protein n=1 Tax=Streptomyces zingiberis TaxID=2053010 RepID=A0ABX1BUC9_9ACTN|nr:DUF6350 family protein [Streptomyces zingiberis]NJQ00683.1 hypothetical protein [Streptomyces zingiberis]
MGAATAGLAGGAVAAGLGIGLPAMAVLGLWIVSADAGAQGVEGALRAAAALWLLGHGVELLRVTEAGATAPVGLPPLLLGLFPLWLLYRTARRATGAGEPPASPGGGAVFATLGWLCAGYLLVGLVGLYAVVSAGEPLRASPGEASVRLCALCVGAVLCGAWVSGGLAAHRLPERARARVDRLPRGVRVLAGWALPGAVPRAAGAGAAVLVGGGTLLVAGSLIVHGGAAADALTAAHPSWPGRIAVVLLCLALLPNAAVWAAAYGLGPGFTVGAGSTVTAVAATGYPDLPGFPLLAALPAEGPGMPPVAWAAGALPFAAGAAVGWYAARAARRLRAAGGPAPAWWRTPLTALYASAVCGVAVGLLAAASGGALGTGALSWLGPDPWETGVAAAARTAVPGPPVALALHCWWLLRERWRARRSRDVRPSG